MTVAPKLRNAFGILLPLAVACTIYLYLYPVFSQCAFPLPSRNAADAFHHTTKLHWPYAQTDDLATIPTERAPFRLLTFGDPQLEGDTSIPVAYLGLFPHIGNIFKHLTFQTRHNSLWERLRWIIHDSIDIYMIDIPDILESFRKVFDLWGNDFYLAHIYRALHWWTKPTHVTVLGDLLGSQWIDDAEFERRGHRFWNRTFKGGIRVDDSVAMYPLAEYNLSGILNGAEEEAIWTKRIINVAGNHDIGYAGDLTVERMERFERIFGKANYELRFELPVEDEMSKSTIYHNETNPYSRRLQPELRILVLNDMNLDTPAKSIPLQDQTYDFINKAIGTGEDVNDLGRFTLLLTHIPLYKPEGVCVDAPFFDFHGAHDGGGVKEQYLLSYDASKGLLEGIFGMSGDVNAAGNGKGRRGMILNGHDHEGCDTYHFINQTNGTEASERRWEVNTWPTALEADVMNKPNHPGLREITVRSMMGDFGGNAGLLSMWFNFTTWAWEHEYVSCPLGRQHLWWLTHILDLGVILLAILWPTAAIVESKGVDLDAKIGEVAAYGRRALELLHRQMLKAQRVWNAAVAELMKPDEVHGDTKHEVKGSKSPKKAGQKAHKKA
ncbi:hypothetical protein VHEMI09834 [[Torrubiella] hemipterigena]|uniref:Calcineurin-like phosphoesterase domain-containing protein n=1 Tax=[Torrubiella] hemipterigena TaxID=1531966 RepID=A0A0A1TR26_9HYPO|nr:hypothetical protein VHEMI09834 [[Torrubiella] hemipterigena]